MKEQQISYETAKLCKELGIDLSHTHYYIYPFRKFKADGELKKNLVPDDYHDTMLQIVSARKNQPQIAPAYTQSLLQRYLREKHNIDVDVSRDQEIHYKDEIRWIVKVSDWNDIKIVEYSIAHLKHPNHFHFIDFKSYEKALESGLIEALKMVKSAETKQQLNETL